MIFPPGNHFCIKCISIFEPTCAYWANRDHFLSVWPKCFGLHCEKSYQKINVIMIIMVLLLWQEGLIANVKLHSFPGEGPPNFFSRFPPPCRSLMVVTLYSRIAGLDDDIQCNICETFFPSCNFCETFFSPFAIFAKSFFNLLGYRNCPK